ncbi:MAG: 7TM diverse intracellular signaling domain-containing protein [Myxococcales bacterium]
MTGYGTSGRFIAAVAVLVGLGAAFALGGCPGREPVATARQGVIDLSGVELAKRGHIGLDGEWELYWNQLLSPEELAAGSPAPSGYLALPTAWNDFEIGGQPVGSRGCATLRLKLVPAPGRQRLALRVFNVNAAFALYVDGKLTAQSGRVAEQAEKEVAAPSDVLARFETEGRPVELVLQVSNHAYRAAGPLASLELGTEEAMAEDRSQRWAWALFCAGCLLMMGVYHLAFFSFRRSEKALADFGAYCLLWLGYYLGSESSGWVTNLVLPGLSSRVLDGISMACFFVTVPVGYRFFLSLYPAEFSTTLLRVAAALAAAFVGLAALAPSWVFTWSQPAYYLSSSLLIVDSLVRLERARRNRRDGAAYILAGFLVLGLCGINDMLKDLQVLRTVYLLPVGMLAFVMSQALALAGRFARSFAAEQRLTLELAGRNEALEREMAERARLEREIVRTSEAERRRLSHHLHDGVCQLLTAARLRSSALRSTLEEPGAGAGPGEAAQAFSKLSDLLEQASSQAYDLSRGLWPAEDAKEADGASLEELARRFAASSGIAVECRLEGWKEAGREQAAQLFRIAQEALVNAAKHSRATRVEVSLERSPPRSLTLRVRDDGVGRAAAAATDGGLGLRIMAHRASIVGGTLEIADGEAGGTVVSCTVPCGIEHEAG